MSMNYHSVASAMRIESIVKKSKFISYIMPVHTVEEAQGFIENIRKKHGDATHNVWALRVGFPIPLERFSDDGEPSGTAGIPVLEVIRKKQLTNVAIVVTRYFGGVLLGAGGLVRAYTDSAASGLNEAGVAEFVLHRRMALALPYPMIGSVLKVMEQLDVRLEGSEYGTDVTVSGWVRIDNVLPLEKKIEELGQGQLHPKWLEEKYLKAANPTL